MYFVVSKV
jgi:hypothetical protein